jgi:hypothetical protein
MAGKSEKNTQKNVKKVSRLKEGTGMITIHSGNYSGPLESTAPLHRWDEREKDAV